MSHFTGILGNILLKSQKHSVYPSTFYLKKTAEIQKIKMMGSIFSMTTMEMDNGDRTNTEMARLVSRLSKGVTRSPY
jgi:hypothetical protein